MDDNHVGRVTLLPLGTGKGATSVYEGEPSSAFAVVVDGKCRLLVDMGIGVVQQCIKYCGGIPDLVYISHNHTDHTGDLPVALIVEKTAGHKLTIVSAPDVQSRIREHRIHELYSTGNDADALANWIAAPEGVLTAVDADFAIVTHRGRHSEVSYGFVLHYQGRPVLGFSADSGFDQDLYAHLAIADVVVIDARAKGSAEHAGFSELDSFRDTLHKQRVFVTGYGTVAEQPREAVGRLVIGRTVVLR